MSATSPRFAHAVLIVNGRYVLQHRDDKPGIAWPGAWSLFGGHLETGEDPLPGLTREIREELGLAVDGWRPFWTVTRFSDFARADSFYNFFEADVSEAWPRHTLMEGQRAAAFTFDELVPLRMPPLMREVLTRHHAERTAC